MKNYFKRLYERTMREAHAQAYAEIVRALRGGGNVLDCGANTGKTFHRLNEFLPLERERYRGIEWNGEVLEIARRDGLDVVKGDLNRRLPFDDDSFDCVFGLSVIEHLLNGCRFIRECRRVLKPGGTLVLLTPNISTYFTAALILAGRMPSSGPHPDSEELIKREELFKVSSELTASDAESDEPVHRHLVVFSYRVLHDFLGMAGFREVSGRGYGLYPFPNFMQPLLERLDPWH
ncbi:MAG TPA: methyltransferase domain-containing protein, partial [Gammaproteobacteria bacterium]